MSILGDDTSRRAYKNAIQKACKGQRVNGGPRMFWLEPEMAKFNGQVPFTVERKGEYLYYVLDAAPAFGSDMVNVFLTARRKING